MGGLLKSPRGDEWGKHNEGRRTVRIRVGGKLKIEQGLYNGRARKANKNKNKLKEELLKQINNNWGNGENWGEANIYF